VKAKDDTAKVLGETVFKGGVEDVEELQAEDPMLEQPIEDIETINNQLTPQQKKDAELALDQLEKADEEFAGEEEKDAAVETVLASRGESMKDIDTNGDGLLDEKEVSKEIQGDMVKVDPQAPKKQKAIQNKMLKSLFGAADENADGKLDINELFVFHNVQTLATTEPKEYFKVKAMDHITYMDKNHDEEVDWQEFQNFMLPHVKAAIHAQDVSTDIKGEPNPKQIQQHMKKFKELFDEADLNKDGKLDKKEMEKNLEEREEWIKGEAATETMQVADDNKDGKVSLNEVIKNAAEYGAKTEDFFEDSELLHVGKGDGDAESAMAKESLLEQREEVEQGEDGSKIKFQYKKFARYFAQSILHL